ncbi:MAG TPA: indole-3-glycerol phosphate synthase TrpC [Cyclobacteriaceae bacterium]|jgi:indole-3-glycerol phosphate synthase|nr:indole-3-glycerol phosphate synthase TrpC [Cyclobacteriaceae bacterium]
MNILDKIVEQKRKEVAECKSLRPVKQLEQSKSFLSPTVSLKEFVQRKDLSGIITEIKRKSPSKGIINPDVSIERTSIGYVKAGASALSILTDKEFFGGNNEDLMEARKFNSCPILRKDFTIDEYQIIEAKSIGADAILLISAILDPKQAKQLASFAHSLKLEVLFEVHSEEELHAQLFSDVDLIGVNNRNLKTFEVSLDVSRRLIGKIPKETVKISESGISSVEAIDELRGIGFDGFLMGENFMKNSRPEDAAKEFMSKLKNRK